MIEFIKGEKWCRWNGILMSPRKCKQLFGTAYELYLEKGFIVDDCTIYTDKPIGKILVKFGVYHPVPKEYDEVLNQGYGWRDYCLEKELGNKYTFDADFIKNLKVKPMSQFAIDYPNFNKEQHEKFYRELDRYYRKLTKHGKRTNTNTGTKVVSTVSEH